MDNVWAVLAHLVILFALVMGVVGACAVEPMVDIPVSNAELAEDLVARNVYRFVDPEYGIVCYQYRANYGGGISCLPIEDWQWK